MEHKSRVNGSVGLSPSSRSKSRHQRPSPTSNDCDGTQLAEQKEHGARCHSKDRIWSVATSLDCYQHIRDGRKCYMEQPASRRPHLSPHVPKWSAVREPEIDESLVTQRYRGLDRSNLCQPSPASMGTPSSNICSTCKREPDSCKASHRILLWPSIKSLLKETGVRPKEGYVTDDENLPKLPTYSSARDNNGSDRHFSVSESRSGGGGSRTLLKYPLNGNSELSISKINSYFTSFMERIHITYPFLDATDLRKSFDDFIAQYNPRSQHPFKVPCERLPNDFRNMLVLCATYLDYRLQCLVDRHRLLDLLAGTITFLERLASFSATCRYNCSTLKSIRVAFLRSSGWYLAGLTMASAAELSSYWL
jgi:hypothetical protein